MERLCTSCGELLPLSFFRKGAAPVAEDGRCKECTACHYAFKIRQVKRRQADRARIASEEAAKEAKAVFLATTTKECKECGVEKPLAAFPANAYNESFGEYGRSRTCKECYATLYGEESRLALHRERSRDYDRALRDASSVRWAGNAERLHQVELRAARIRRQAEKRSLATLAAQAGLSLQQFEALDPDQRDAALRKVLSPGRERR